MKKILFALMTITTVAFGLNANEGSTTQDVECQPVVVRFQPVIEVCQPIFEDRPCSYESKPYTPEVKSCSDEGSPISVEEQVRVEDCQTCVPCYNHGLYIGAYGGANFLHKPSHRVSGNGGLALGYKFYNLFRLEVEGNYRYSTIHHLRHKYPVETYSAMANLYIDFNTGYCVTPYLGAGVGYSYTDVGSTIKREKILDKLHNLSYQGIAGIAFDVGAQMQIGTEYRCFLIKNDIRDHSAIVTLKHFF